MKSNQILKCEHGQQFGIFSLTLVINGSNFRGVKTKTTLRHRFFKYDKNLRKHFIFYTKKGYNKLELVKNEFYQGYLKYFNIVAIFESFTVWSRRTVEKSFVNYEKHLDMDWMIRTSFDSYLCVMKVSEEKNAITCLWIDSSNR